MTIAFFPSLADTLHLPAERLHPTLAPVTVAELAAQDGEWAGRRCELFAGMVVEKPVGARESLIGGHLHTAVQVYIWPRRLGFTFPADGGFAFGADITFYPDVSFVPRSRCPDGKLPTAAVCPIVPALAAEVLSDSNTEAEMRYKRTIYFAQGVQLVWEVDIQLRTVAVFTQADPPATVLNRTQTLDGGAVLPGFTLALADLFAALDE
jgi:Uma2 family endonuclease